MCLYIDESVHGTAYSKQKPFIAQTDIVVWKLLIKDFDFDEDKTVYLAPYRRTLYVLGQLYKSKLGKDWCAIDEGLHCFSNHRKARMVKELEWDFDTSVFWAIIPKGSKVYVGTDKELVSNQLIVYKSKKDLEAVHGKIQPAIAKDIALAT